MNVGTPILAFNPASEVSRRMAAGMAPLLPEGMQSRSPTSPSPERPARRGLFARIFHLTPPSTGS